MYVKARIAGKIRLCLFDSGSEVNLIPASCIPETEIIPSTRTLTAANESKINVLGTITVTLNISRCLILPTKFIVSDQVVDAILGTPWMIDHQC